MGAEMTETQAKAEWDNILPQPDTIAWYNKWFAINGIDVASTDPRFYNIILGEYREWAATYENDIASDPGYADRCLEDLRHQYREAIEDDEEEFNGEPADPRTWGLKAWPAPQG